MSSGRNSAAVSESLVLVDWLWQGFLVGYLLKRNMSFIGTLKFTIYNAFPPFLYIQVSICYTFTSTWISFFLIMANCIKFIISKKIPLFTILSDRLFHQIRSFWLIVFTVFQHFKDAIPLWSDFHCIWWEDK